MRAQELADQVLDHMKSEGFKQSQVRVTLSETTELELTGDKVNLCRTNHDFDVRLKAVQEGRQALVSSNRWSEDSAQTLMGQLHSGLEASQVDPAFAIYSKVSREKFQREATALNLTDAIGKMKEFAESVRSQFPKVGLRSMPLKVVKTQSCLLNSFGLNLSHQESYFDYFVMFSGRSGDKTGSFNYISQLTDRLPEDFLKQGSLSFLLNLAEKETEAVAHHEEIKGDVVLSPFVLPSFLGFLIDQISTTSLISKTSLFGGRKGERVVSDLFSLQFDPFGSQFATEVPFSGEGILFEKGSIFEEGVLRNYLLDVYGANKLNEQVTPQTTSNIFVPSGPASFQDMIKGIKKGLMLMRFSGGSPSPNGDFSGVAKNSFLIENGEITKPLKEVMISGNIPRLFSEIKQVSRDVVNNGSSEYPWIHSRL